MTSDVADAPAPGQAPHRDSLPFRDPEGDAIHAEGLRFRYRGTRLGGTARPPWRRARTATTRVPDGAHRADGTGAAWVLDGLSLACARGETVAILGPNGAGKSTLLRVLATLLPPAAGAVRLLGYDAYPPETRLRRRIGFAGDSAVHLDALTGRENVVFFARAAGLDRGAAGAAANSLLRRLGLDDAARRPAAEYSLGMSRKLLLAGALAHSPELVLLDEPTIGLDPAARDALRQMLRERAHHGAAMLIATHDTAEAARVCDRVVFLHRGAIVLDGAPDELIRRLGGPTRIEIRTAETPATTRTPTVAGVRIESVDPGHVRAATRAGAAALPALCDALIRAGAAIRSVRVREPDLTDVFRAVTGSELDQEPHQP